MTEVLNVPLGQSAETQIGQEFSSKRPIDTGAQSTPISTQPGRSIVGVLEMPQEEEFETEQKKEDDCCCAPYAEDENAFCLVSCIAWYCLHIGRCAKSCHEVCGGCFKSDETEINRYHNSGEGCCLGCGSGCGECDECEMGDGHYGFDQGSTYGGDDWCGAGDGNDTSGGNDCSGGGDTCD